MTIDQSYLYFFPNTRSSPHLLDIISFFKIQKPKHHPRLCRHCFYSLPLGFAVILIRIGIRYNLSVSCGIRFQSPIILCKKELDICATIQYWVRSFFTLVIFTDLLKTVPF
jgi:hypothetical protein